MIRQIPKAGAVAVIAACLIGSLPIGAQDVQTPGGVVTPAVINLFHHESLGTPLLAAALAAVAQTDGAEDAKARATRFVQGAVPALVGRSMPSVEWQSVGVTSDIDGAQHVRLQQTAAGLRVFGAEVVVHFNSAAAVAGLNGEVLSDVAVPKAALTIDSALKAARAALNLGRDLAAAEAELLVYNPALIGAGASSNHIAYYFVLESPRNDESYTALVDARSGKLLISFNNLDSSRNRDIRDLGNTTSLPGSQCHTESTPVGSSPPDCLGAYRFSGEAYDYFQRLFGRDSYDGAGATMIASVRYGTTANAFWTGRQTVFGPGFVTKDVVAHEWTHALIDNTARLVYVNQPGAISESMADIFASMIDVDEPDWLIGEDLDRGAIRSLTNPAQFGHPSRVSDSQFYCGAADNGGIHTNSGVLNRGASLMALGGTHNGRTVNAIGREATARVFYRALTTYFTSGTSFLDAYNALNTACADLNGGSGSATCGNVRTALQAVELDQAVCSATTVGTPDAFEDDDTATASSVLARTYSNEEQHTFHDSGDTDWVRFTVAANASIRVDTTNLETLTDTVLRLYGTNGTSVLAEDDDSGGGLSSRIDYTFTTAGTYYVRVTHFNPSVFGANTGYRLRINPFTASGDPFEPDNSVAQATSITPNGDAQTGHTLGQAGDNDWARFTATANTVYVIQTENLLPSSDTFLAIYGADGVTPLASDDDGGGRLSSRITWQAPTSGTYYVRVRHYGSAMFGPNTAYDLRLNTTTAIGDSFESDDKRSDARAITLGTPQTHDFHLPSDFDWVSFSATAGTSYTVQTTNLQTRADTVLDLYGSNGELIASNDDSAGGLASTIVHTPTTSGTLYARVRQLDPRAFGASTGYTLRASTTTCTGADTFESNDTIASATPVTVNAASAQSHNHACAGDVDVLRFTANRNMDYDLRTFNLGAAADTVMTLTDAAGTQQAFNDDGGSGLAARIFWRAPADGTYYAAIRHYSPVASGTTTNYQVSISATGTSGAADNFEEDDTQTAARTLSTSSPHLNHNFHDAGDADWLALSVTSGSHYAVETFNLALYADTIVEVYNGSTQLVRNDNGGGGLASRATFTAPASGTVHIKVYHANSQQHGANTSYSIRAGAVSLSNDGDLFEPDNTSGNAKVLSTTIAQQHDFHTAGDVDWATFNAAASTTYTISTANLGPTADTVLDLYQSDGTTLIASNDDGGGGLSSRIIYTATATGALFVRVRDYNPSASGGGSQYELRLSAPAAVTGDSFEPDDTPAQARTLAAGSTQTGHTFHVAGDLDWVQFSATAGTPYILETLNLGARSDTVLDLFDANQVLIQHNDDSGSSLASRIEFTAPATATFYVRIAHFSTTASGSDTNYDFRITLNSGCTNTRDNFEPDNTTAEATGRNVPMSPGTRQGHQFGCAGDVDWVQLTNLAPGARYAIETTELGTGADTVMTLYNSSATTRLAENDDSGGTLASRIEFTTETVPLWQSQAPMPTARFEASGGVVNGIIYVYGGRTTSEHLSSFEAYNPATNSWSTLTSPGVIQTGAVSGVYDGKIYFAGGTDGTNVLQTLRSYDVATNTWTTLAPMPTPRSHAAGGIIDGVLYVAGGFLSSGSVTGTLEAYSIATNSWTTLAATSSRAAGGSAVVNGRLFIFGGRVFDGTTVATYTPATNSWHNVNAHLFRHRDYPPTAVIGSQFYIIGGSSRQAGLAAVDVVNTSRYPEFQTTPGPLLPVGRYGGLAAVVNGRIYVIGGSLGEPETNRVDSYLPQDADAGPDRWIRVRHFNPLSSGSTTSYSVRLTLLSSSSLDSYEPDNTFSQAKQLTAAAPHTGSANHSFHAAGDVDWVFFDGTAGNHCFFETYDLGARSDTRLWLYASDGVSELALDDDTGNGLGSLIGHTMTATGRYFLRVQHYNSSSSGSDTQYSVRVSCGATDVYEPDNTPTQASTLAVNGVQSHRITNNTDDVDWIRFSATAGTRYVVQRPTGHLCAYAYVYASDTTTLVVTENDAFTASTTGNYYVHVTTFGQFFDCSYTVQVRTLAYDANPPVATVSVDRNDDGTVQLRVRPSRDAEAIKIQVLAKPELLAFTRAQSLLTPKPGDGLANVQLLQSAASEPGTIAAFLDTSNTPIASVNALALDYRVIAPLPDGRTNVFVRVTLIDRDGGVTVDTFPLEVESNAGTPRISAINPTTMATETGGLVEAYGSNFVSPKLFLLSGGSAMEMLDVAYAVDGTRLDAVIPARTKAGVYKVRIQNSNGAYSDSDDDFVITEGAGTCNFSLSTSRVTVSGAGGSGNVGVGVGQGCLWTAIPGATWLHVTPPGEGTGDGAVTFSADPSTSGEREGLITIGNRTLTVAQPPNTAPQVSAIANRSIEQGTTTGAIAFTVTDADDDAITLSASSSNATLVPVGNISFGSGTTNGAGLFATVNRTVTVTPVASEFGTTTITITASDGRGGMGTTAFELTVTRAQDLGPPRELSARVDGTLIDLEWLAPSSGLAPSGYRIEAGSTPGQTITSMEVGTVTRASLNLPVAGTYYVRVRALNGTQVGPASNEVTVGIGVPGRPQNFAAAVAGNRVTFTWTAPASGTVDRYSIEVGSTPQTSNLAVVPVAATSLTVDNVPNGQYFLRVRAENSAGAGPASNEVELQIPGGGSQTPPGAPQSLQGNVAGSTVTFSWSAPTGSVVSDYVLEAGTTPGASDLATAPIGSATSFTVPNVPDGRYYVRVRGRNVAGVGPPSNEVTITVGTPVEIPGAPIGLTATLAGATVLLTWTAPTSGGPVETYVIDAGSAPSASNLAQAAIGVTTTFSATGVPSGTYYVRIRAWNRTGISGASNEIVLTVP